MPAKAAPFSLSITSRLIVLITLLAVAAMGVTWWVRQYLAVNSAPVQPGVPVMLAVDATPSALATPAGAVKYRVEPVVGGLEVPWSVVFTSPDRMLISERPGRIRAVEAGQLKTEPLLTLPVSSQDEEGLMGLVLDPAYAKNRQLYACYAFSEEKQLKTRVVRLLDEGSRISVVGVVVDNIPAARFHAGCELSFGPDGNLYISTGDATDRDLAQNPQSLAGKILRVNSNGTVPLDNPVAGSLVYSLGHRNPQGLSWHPLSKQLWSAEHGPSGFDGPGGGDEINAIEPGGNYGWPTVSHDRSLPGLIDPLLTFTPAIAPGSTHFYSGKAIPEWKNRLLVSALKGEGLFVMDVTATPAAVVRYEKLPGIEIGRIREVTEGPDGTIYLTSSNRDGRGRASASDDQVYRLVKE